MRDAITAAQRATDPAISTAAEVAGRRSCNSMIMKIEKELERVDLFRNRRTAPAVRSVESGSSGGARLPELDEVSGSGFPAIVAVWFAWWYLRPTTQMPWSAVLPTTRTDRIKVRTKALSPH